MIIKALSEPNKKSIWLALGWTCIILFFSFKAPNISSKYIFPHQDKVVHFMFYFVFVFLWYRFLFFKRIIGIKVLLIVAIIAFLLGVSVEVLQGTLTLDRYADIYDVLANTTGILVGILFNLKLFK